MTDRLGGRDRRDMRLWPEWERELRLVCSMIVPGKIDTEAFRPYYEDGDTPAEALAEDLNET